MALTVTSCGFSRFVAVTDGASLTQSNFKYVSTVTGRTTATLVFGIGGLSRKSSAENAVRNMFVNASLQPNQTITNIAVSQTNKIILGIICIRTTIATGQVVEFAKPEIPEPKEEEKTELPSSWYSY